MSPLGLVPASDALVPAASSARPPRPLRHSSHRPSGRVKGRCEPPLRSGSRWGCAPPLTHLRGGEGVASMDPMARPAPSGRPSDSCMTPRGRASPLPGCWSAQRRAEPGRLRAGAAGGRRRAVRGRGAPGPGGRGIGHRARSAGGGGDDPKRPERRQVRAPQGGGAGGQPTHGRRGGAVKPPARTTRCAPLDGPQGSGPW